MVTPGEMITSNIFRNIHFYYQLKDKFKVFNLLSIAHYFYFILLLCKE